MSKGENLERRVACEWRATSARSLEGYAALFAVPARIGDFEERIAAGAFKGSLNDGNDILALVDHDPARLLARTKTGTLKLSEDTRGLHFELSVPDTQTGRDVLALAERGDLGGMSFGFRIPKGGETWEGRTRTLNKIDLREVSVVSAWPAYQGTSIAARARMDPATAAALAILRGRMM